MEKEIDLDEIIEVPLRNHFPREDVDFTPWLAQNLDLLGKTIGIDLIASETESPIGSYRLDILAEESGSERKIAIENQFGTTDHSHLGQLITYMAGVNADVVIWLAEDFRDEHITAINHLNQISSIDTNLFAIKPRLIKIGDSKPALEFVIKAQPDTWEKDVKGQSQINKRELEYKKFWSELIELYSIKIPEFKLKRPTIYNSMSFMVKNGISYGWGFTRNRNFRIVLWIDTGKQERNHEILDEILKYKNDIESKLGKDMRYFRDQKVQRIAINLYKEINSDIMNLNDETREELLNWSVRMMPKFREVFDPLIKKIV